MGKETEALNNQSDMLTPSNIHNEDHQKMVLSTDLINGNWSKRSTKKKKKRKMKLFEGRLSDTVNTVMTVFVLEAV